MKIKNNSLRIFLITIALTIFFSSIAIYSIIQVKANNPNITKTVEKMIRSTYSINNFNLRLDSNYNASISDNDDEGDLVSTIETWKFSDKIKEIRIDLISADIQFLSSTENEILVKASGSIKKGDSSEKVNKLIHITSLTDKLKLEEFDTNSIQHLNLEVSIPKSYQNRLIINTVSSDISLKQTHFQILEIETVSGNLAIIDSSDNKIKINTVAGDVSIGFNNKFLNELNFSVDSVSGSINSSLPSNPSGKKEINIYTISGDIDIH